MSGSSCLLTAYEAISSKDAKNALLGAFLHRFLISQRHWKAPHIRFQSYYRIFPIPSTVSPLNNSEKGSLSQPGPIFAFFRGSCYFDGMRLLEESKFVKPNNLQKKLQISEHQMNLSR